MNTQFLNYMLKGCKFPEEASKFFNELADDVVRCGLEAEFDAIADYYMTSGCDTDGTGIKLAAFAEKTGASDHSYWMLLLLLNAERMQEKYYARGVTEEVFLDTFSDLRCKAIECMEEHGVWGTFVEGWYGLFYTCRIIKFGRFEYQDETYGWRDLDIGDVKLRHGTKCLSIHIPSSGEPFDLEARMESYKAAFDFYSREIGGPLVCICGSWLLYPGYENVFPAGSNTVDFMKDFYIVKGVDESRFHDDWRVFGKAHHGPVEDLPEDTRMRRAFKRYMLEGGKYGEGLGVLIYDGEKLVTRR